MIEVLQFVFSSFWVWAGCTIMLSILVSCIVGCVEAIRGNGNQE